MEIDAIINQQQQRKGYLDEDNIFRDISVEDSLLQYCSP
jgi:hypothetical protein